MTSWKVVTGASVALFAAGVAVGVVANQQGIAQNEIPRWFIKGTTRRVLHAFDAVRGLMPTDPPTTEVGS